MATTKTCSGLMTMAGSFRQALLGDGMSNGPTMTFSNGITLKSDNFSGWLNGTATVVGGHPVVIDLLNATDPFGDSGDAEFLPGFDPNADGQYMVGFYFEALENPSGDGYGRPSASKKPNSMVIEVFYPIPESINGTITVVGDVFSLVNQAYYVPLDSSYAKVRVTLMADGGIAADENQSAMFRACFLYRKNQYPVK